MTKNILTTRRKYIITNQFRQVDQHRIVLNDARSRVNSAGFDLLTTKTLNSQHFSDDAIERRFGSSSNLQNMSIDRTFKNQKTSSIKLSVSQ